MQQSVRLIKVMNVRSFVEVANIVRRRYPGARLHPSAQTPGMVLIAIPDLHWNASPNGPESFFRGLCQSGVISGFHHKRYSDQEEVRY